jgi:hypothetical protein
METTSHRSKTRIAIAVTLAFAWLVLLAFIWGNQRLVAGGFKTIPAGSINETFEMGDPLPYATIHYQQQNTYQSYPSGIGGTLTFGTMTRKITWHPGGLALAIAISLVSGAIVVGTFWWSWRPQAN